MPGDRLISFGDVKSLFGLRVNHPEDFLNVVCHLLEAFFGIELYLLGAPQRSGVEDNQNGENSGSKKQEGGEYVECTKLGPEYCQKHSEQDNANNYQDERRARISHPCAWGFSTGWVNFTHCISGTCVLQRDHCGSAIRCEFLPKP